MDELRLTIIVPPLPALRPDAPDTAILEKHFVSYKTPQTTIQRLFSDLQREYANKYLPDSAKNAFVIKYLRDEYLCDLEYGHTLAYLFTGRKEPHCINVVPTWSNRESSLPVNSTLRPPDIAPLPPKRKILPPVPLFHEAEHKKRRIEGEQTDYGSLDPDRPLKSRERDLPDEGHLGSGFDREDDEERTLVADGGSADKVVRRGRTSSSSSVRHGGRQHTAGRDQSITTPNENHAFAKPSHPASRGRAPGQSYLRNSYSVDSIGSSTSHYGQRHKNQGSGYRRIKSDIFQIPDSGDEFNVHAQRPSLEFSLGRNLSASFSSSRRVSDATQNDDGPLLTPESSRIRAQQAALANHQIPPQSVSRPRYKNGRRADRDFAIHSPAEPQSDQEHTSRQDHNIIHVDEDAQGRRSSSKPSPEYGAEHHSPALDDDEAAAAPASDDNPDDQAAIMEASARSNRAASQGLHSPFNSFYARDSASKPAGPDRPSATPSRSKKTSLASEGAHQRLQTATSQPPHLTEDSSLEDAAQENVSTDKTPADAKLTLPKWLPINGRIKEYGNENNESAEKAIRQQGRDMYKANSVHAGRQESHAPNSAQTRNKRSVSATVEGIDDAVQETPVKQLRVPAPAGTVPPSRPKSSSEQSAKIPATYMSSAVRYGPPVTQPMEGIDDSPIQTCRAKSTTSPPQKYSSSYNGRLKQPLWDFSTEPSSSKDNGGKRKRDSEPTQDTASKKQKPIDFKGKGAERSKAIPKHVLDQDPIVLSDSDSVVEIPGRSASKNNHKARISGTDPVVKVPPPPKSTTPKGKPQASQPATGRRQAPKQACTRCNKAHRRCEPDEHNPQGPCQWCQGKRLQCSRPESASAQRPARSRSTTAQSRRSLTGTPRSGAEASKSSLPQSSLVLSAQLPLPSQYEHSSPAPANAEDRENQDGRTQPNKDDHPNPEASSSSPSSSSRLTSENELRRRNTDEAATRTNNSQTEMTPDGMGGTSMNQSESDHVIGAYQNMFSSKQTSAASRKAAAPSQPTAPRSSQASTASANPSQEAALFARSPAPSSQRAPQASTQPLPPAKDFLTASNLASSNPRNEVTSFARGRSSGSSVPNPTIHSSSPGPESDSQRPGERLEGSEHANNGAMASQSPVQADTQHTHPSPAPSEGRDTLGQSQQSSTVKDQEMSLASPDTFSTDTSSDDTSTTNQSGDYLDDAQQAKLRELPAASRSKMRRNFIGAWNTLSSYVSVGASSSSQSAGREWYEVPDEETVRFRA